MDQLCYNIRKGEAGIAIHLVRAHTLPADKDSVHERTSCMQSAVIAWFAQIETAVVVRSTITMSGWCRCIAVSVDQSICIKAYQM